MKLITTNLKYLILFIIPGFTLTFGSSRYEILTKDATHLRYKINRSTNLYPYQINNRTLLIGKWENAIPNGRYFSESGYPITEEVLLSIHFQEDGTYERHLANNVLERVEKGKWKLSEDGNQITLINSDTGNSIQLEIRHLESDEMVLGLKKIQSQNKNEENAGKNIFFNKI